MGTSQFGEIYLGTMHPLFCAGTPTQSFFRYTAANGLEEIANHYQSTAGTVIYKDTVYHNDGCQQAITARDRNPVTGELGRLRFQ